MTEYFEDIGTILLALLALIGVLVLAYFTTRWLSGRSVGGHGKGIIEILDRQHIAQDKSFLIVRAGKKILLVGLTNQNITKLTELDEDDVIVAPSSPQVNDFSTTLKMALGRRRGDSSRETPDSSDKSSDGGNGGL